MNSLNILSARVSPPQTPASSRSNSYGNILTTTKKLSGDINEKTEITTDAAESEDGDDATLHEETPLLSKESEVSWHSIPRTISIAILDSVRWVLSTLAAPGVYLIACFYDERGKFAPFTPLRKLGAIFSGGLRRSTTRVLGASADEGNALVSQSNARSTGGKRGLSKTQRAMSSRSSSSGLSSESESERDRAMNDVDQTSTGPNRHTRSKSLQSEDEIAPARRSIRIKLHNEDNLRQRKHRKAQSTNTQSNGSGAISAGEISPATLKSPTSPASSLLMTKYPRAPVPPRPLIPRRQPSFTVSDPPNGKLGQKTLILDLDETLIHSLAKGGRMGTGHMIEVRLNIAGPGGSGPQHPILYYVHKRPHCDDFLRRVCKWYNLVVFTASVQEYADPVIDYLEQERKFFSGRYYRQHCTFRHGAFIKDLSSVEPDLSKVMILDNSPLSYMFHQGKVPASRRVICCV
ncbi:Nuclear envelope morphology 1 [Hyphodiscus hymeniophilus]|uniref:Nuclear envelope morphology 1 n=1 Tax=Hyphodiscus hymeniophilus TaxID=353542 RepID=A0A9P7B0C2_9HELO|nr:Nuclear envelope morphology 1 [Hyphodiscus hymeniophilus]